MVAKAMVVTDHVTDRTTARSRVDQKGFDTVNAPEQIVWNVRYFAGARAAAGVAEEPVSLPRGTSVRAALEILATRRGERLAKVLPACSFLLDGVAVKDRDLPVREPVELDVLPPFAGG
ncbi:molybdopterin converting factor, small subunit [Actinoalloteichus hymeniacidonis]|uniref:Molybdopterin converting factor, small subunit n=1 Tax=Actinoalloteichus hymeniacidonis TaxID=340345 RepID=A0AAC9HUA3_9PSEU|nr:molybdopterin converting factor, small subunit [Actinoalloteichus hymeniacidonis]